LLHSFESLRRQYWGRHLWARGYFCCSSGNVTDDVIKAYIEHQSHDDSDFKVEDEE
jgi:putative transposase